MTDRPCWAHHGCHGDVHLYQNGPACDAHSPAALNGRTAPTPDPDLTIAGLREASITAKEESPCSTPSPPTSRG